MKIIEALWEDHKTVVIETRDFYMAIKLPKDEKVEVNLAKSGDHEGKQPERSQVH